ncbi:MAG: right-handed parallel beta-helix repeat-containing protein [Candidatus Hodarchaeota archaeon]
MSIWTQILRGSSKHYIYAIGVLLVLLLVFPISKSRLWATNFTQVHSDQYNHNFLEICTNPKNPTYKYIPVFRSMLDIPIKRQVVSINAPSAYKESSPIIIDNNTDFSVKASDFSWFGDGSPNKPYSIDNLNITGNFGSEILLFIKNTDIYFNITNCLLQNGERGIQLENVTHGYIYNNIIFNNKDYGIVLQGNSSYNTISTNLVNNSHAAEGITIDQSENNSLLFNIVCNGDSQGIYVSSSNNTVVSNNYVYYNIDEGLMVWNSRNCTFADNTIYNNSKDGIELYESENNSIKNSIIFNNGWYGIQMRESEHCILSNLTVYNSGRAGIRFWYSGHSKINNVNSSWNNHDYGYEDGNFFEYSGNSTFSRLFCSKNYGAGIRFTYSGNSTFSEITSSKNEGSGAFIQYSDNSALSDILSFDNKGDGISLDDFRFCSFHNITTINNSYNGLRGSYSSNITFSNINSSYNYKDGISWTDVHNSIISNSNCYNNSGNGIKLDNSQNNTLLTNIIYNNGIPFNYDTDAGINLYYVKACNMTSNSVYSNEIGIYLSNTNNSFISNNAIYNNLGVGFSFQHSAGNIVANNIIYHNRGYGFYSYYWIESGDPTPENNILRRNDFIGNGYHGQYFYQSDFDGPNFQVDYNFWDNYRFPDSDKNDVVDYPLIVGHYWVEGVEDPNFYDEYPQTQPNNPDSSIHYLTSPIITFPTSWDPANPDDWRESLINGTVTIQWLKPIDTEDHTITYSLYYLQQGWGVEEGNWTEITSGLTTTSYDWDTTNIIDSQYYIRINATCSHGLRSVYQDQGVFSIDNSPPLLTDAQASSYPFVFIFISVIILGVVKKQKKP